MFVKLHLPFPVDRIFFPIRSLCSRRTTRFPSDAAVIAAIIPEAPPPITVIVLIFFSFSGYLCLIFETRAFSLQMLSEQIPDFPGIQNPGVDHILKRFQDSEFCMIPGQTALKIYRIGRLDRSVRGKFDG